MNEVIATRIKQFIDQHPEPGYRTYAWVLKLNKNKMQRVFQLKISQVRKKPKGFRPRVKAFPSVTSQPKQR